MPNKTEAERIDHLHPKFTTCPVCSGRIIDVTAVTDNYQQYGCSKCGIRYYKLPDAAMEVEDGTT